MYIQVPVTTQIWGSGENLLLQGNATQTRTELKACRAQAQCVYLDPPFMTGDRFTRKRPFGTKGWKSGSPCCSFTSYEDRYPNEKAYLHMLRRLVVTAKDLLQNTGIFFLHLDWRMSARGRILCDEVFGRELFLNEIIWTYESGGRATKFFSRKHDTILMYARSPKYRFNIRQVPIPRGEVRHNHMARGMDEDGRTYCSIRSGGKEYRYYDDEPVYPGDVWSDIGYLQQKDPERTGYATQKPVKLLERLLKPVVLPGDLVIDLCCGSGTTLAAAQRLGCRFLGMDLSSEAVTISAMRLEPKDLCIASPTVMDNVPLLAEWSNGRLRLEGLPADHLSFPEKRTPGDVLEAWDTGKIRNKVFYTDQTFRRSFRYPGLTFSLEMQEDMVPAIMTVDAAGIRRAYVWQM